LTNYVINEKVNLLWAVVWLREVRHQRKKFNLRRKISGSLPV